MVYSFWEKSFWNKKFDFIVVGSGFTGLNVAIELKKKHPKSTVVVVDKNIHSSAASTKNAGFACFGSPSELLFDIELMGADVALELLKNRIEGIKKIETLYGKEKIDFRHCLANEWFLKSNAPLYQKVAEKLDWLNQMSNNAVGLNLYSIASHHSPKSAYKPFASISILGEGQLNPMKLHNLLLKRAEGLSIDLLSGFEVDSINGKGVTIKKDLHLKSDFVINCTNAFSSSFENIQKIKPARAQVLITNEIEDLPFDGNYHMDEGFYYFRNVGNRLLLGGARNIDIDGETTFEIGTNKNVIERLSQVLIELLPPAKYKYEIAHNWSGIMGIKDDKRPQVLNEKNTFHLTGMSGMGVALSHSLPEKLVALIN